MYKWFAMQVFDLRALAVPYITAHCEALLWLSPWFWLCGWNLQEELLEFATILLE